MATFARLRSSASRAGAVARFAVGAGALYGTYEIYSRQQQLRADAAYDNDPVLKTPSIKWVPPTRQEMLEALQKNRTLPKGHEPTKSLGKARDEDSSPQSAAAPANLDLGEAGYDLLVRSPSLV